MLTLCYTLLLLLPPADSSGPPCNDVAAIRAYTRPLDHQIKINPAAMKRRGFAGDILETGSTWQETREDKEASAFVYFDGNGHPVRAAFTIATESGDWVLYANYFFRPDGRTALRIEDLRTFYGKVQVIRETSLDAGARCSLGRARTSISRRRNPGSLVRISKMSGRPCTSEQPTCRSLQNS